MIINWSKAPEWAQELAVNPYNEKAWLGDEGYSYLVGNGGVVPWSHETAFARTAFKVIEDRPAPWTGEGLPPVGTVCEVTPHNTAWGFSALGTHTCTVLAYHADFVWIDIGTPGVPVATRIDKVDFRPIRTPEQIAAEAKEKAIKDLIRVTCISHGEAGRIYDAGYRKQVAP